MQRKDIHEGLLTVRIPLSPQAVFFHARTDERIIKTKKIMMCSDRGFIQVFQKTVVFFLTEGVSRPLN